MYRSNEAANNHQDGHELPIYVHKPILNKFNNEPYSPDRKLHNSNRQPFVMPAKEIELQDSKHAERRHSHIFVRLMPTSTTIIKRDSKDYNDIVNDGYYLPNTNNKILKRTVYTPILADNWHPTEPNHDHYCKYPNLIKTN
jgi:hypothetical protein